MHASLYIVLSGILQFQRKCDQCVLYDSFEAFAVDLVSMVLASNLTRANDVLMPQFLKNRFNLWKGHKRTTFMKSP